MPLVETVGLTLCWKKSLSSPWLFGLIGTVVAYVVAATVMFAVENVKPSDGATVSASAAVWRDDGRELTNKPQSTPVQTGPLFAPLTPSWYALLGMILILCAGALWGLRLVFRSPST